jgi:aspartyl/glutamyl-tRNA(Asn/Gln) amidotransferase C subunit
VEVNSVDIKVDKELVRKIADMAMLEFSDEEIEEFVSYFEEMFDVFDMLGDISPDYDIPTLPATLHEDEPESRVDYHDLWMRFSLMKNGYLLVPPLRGGDGE